VYFLLCFSLSFHFVPFYFLVTFELRLQVSFVSLYLVSKTCSLALCCTSVYGDLCHSFAYADSCLSLCYHCIFYIIICLADIPIMQSSDGKHKQYAGTVIKFAGRGWAVCTFSDRIILETGSRNANIHRYREAQVIFTTFLQIQNLKCLYGQYFFNTNMTYSFKTLDMNIVIYIFLVRFILRLSLRWHL
jgi:hypothetical protein